MDSTELERIPGDIREEVFRAGRDIAWYMLFRVVLRELRSGDSEIPGLLVLGVGGGELAPLIS